MSTAKRFTKIETKDRHIPLILKLDASGMPRKWISWQDAVIMKCTDKVLWDLGDAVMLYGGTNASTGLQTEFALRPIIAVNEPPTRRLAPPLTNRELFKRDGFMCMYCGREYPSSKLTRDHIIPTSKGGKNTWMNTICSCRQCNHIKADRTPEQARMPLLAVPFIPNPAEYLLMQNNRRIIADQMDYLRSQVPVGSRILKYIN